MQSTDHTHFYSGPNARSADREDSLSPDTTFQPETHMFLPDKISGKPTKPPPAKAGGFGLAAEAA